MEKEKTLKRDLAIDRFRGIAIFFVVLSLIVGALLGPMAEILEEQGKELPAFFALIDKLFSHHARDGVKLIPNFLPNIIGDNRAGLSLADLFAPMFLFIIGLTIVKSFKSRAEKYGTKQAYFQLAVRSLGLMAIGFLINGLEG
jgi:predicted acyltransferase